MQIFQAANMRMQGLSRDRNVVKVQVSPWSIWYVTVGSVLSVPFSTQCKFITASHFGLKWGNVTFRPRLSCTLPKCPQNQTS